MDKIRWAVAGLNGIGPHHLKNAATAKEVELAIVLSHFKRQPVKFPVEWSESEYEALLKELISGKRRLGEA